MGGKTNLHSSLFVKTLIIIYDFFFRCVIDFKPDLTKEVHPASIFHVSMRPSENVIVRNTSQSGQWGHEERDGHYHIKANEPFIISITAEHSHYRLSLNHKQFAIFKHRMPLQLAQFYQISGDVKIYEITIDHGISTSPAPRAGTITTETTVTSTVPMQMHPVDMIVDLHHNDTRNHRGHNSHKTKQHF